MAWNIRRQLTLWSLNSHEFSYMQCNPPAVSEFVGIPSDL